MTDLERNKDVVRRYFEILTRNDIPAMLELYADDVQLRVPGNTLISGTFSKTQLAEFASQVLDSFPAGLAFSITGMTAEGDRVAVEAQSVGTHVSGAHYNNLYHFLIRVREGKIVESREYMDTQLVTDVICGGKRPGIPGPAPQ